ncbi:hypothetical protein L6R53_14950 [Myxococcota bacterium]|nr:hypothetical protein [Myxococcota bacterium]
MHLALLLLLACASRPPAPDDVPLDQRTDVKRPGNLPVRTEAELAAADAARQSCLDACRAVDAPEADAEAEAGAARQACEAACLQAHPIEQVEVIPSPPSPEP